MPHGRHFLSMKFKRATRIYFTLRMQSQLNNTTVCRLSVALVTRNRSESLRRCLQSLRSQSVQPFEVIVSDDSDFELARDARVVSEEFECTYVKGPRKGLYANRNFAALACNGTHVRTMDDDHTFPEDHFKLCTQAVLSDSLSIWTTGEVGYVNDVFSGRLDMANQLHPCGVGIAPSDPDDNWAIADGSTIYPVSVFQRGYRMLETYSFGSSYLEFGAFLNWHGYRSRCIQGAIIIHHAGRDTTDRMRKYNRDCTCSQIYASLAYNLYFKPNVACAIGYLMSSLVRSRDPGLIIKIPSILRAVQQRWIRGETYTSPYTRSG